MTVKDRFNDFLQEHGYHKYICSFSCHTETMKKVLQPDVLVLGRCGNYAVVDDGVFLCEL